MNKNQCVNLCKKIEHMTKVFNHLINCFNDGMEFELLLSELLFVLNKSYLQVEKCGKPNWYKEAIV